MLLSLHSYAYKNQITSTMHTFTCSVFLQSELAINPLAMVPGAAPPTKNTPTETSVVFDEPVKPNTLTSLTKVHTCTVATINGFFLLH